MRLIDADELKETFSWIEVCTLSKNEIFKIINSAGTIEERQHGNWITDERGYVCSNCGALHVDDYPFCHMCGSENRGGKL